jgi:hypothetical protein
MSRCHVDLFQWNETILRQRDIVLESETTPKSAFAFRGPGAF